MKEDRHKGAPHPSWACFEEAFLGHFIHKEIEEEMVRDFFTLKQDSLCVHEYGLKFIKLSLYSPRMVKDMRSRMSLFDVGLCRASSREGRNAILIVRWAYPNL